MRRLHGFLSRTIFAHAARIEWGALVALILAAAALYAFAELADAVGEGETRVFDERLLLALRTSAELSDPVGPRWVEEMMRDITALGSTAVLTLMVLVVSGFLLLTRKRRSAYAVLLAVVSGVVVSQATKFVYGRPRPELVPHGAEVYSASFPSGHSMMAAVVYLTLGALLARTQADLRVKTFIIGSAVLLALLVGVSRVYLGVHWPTDVLAGWALGSTWALICWTAMLWLQRRGQAEGEARTLQIGAQD